MVDILMNEVAVAEMTGISLSRLRNNRCQKKGIPFVKLGLKSVRYRAREVQDYIETHRVETADTDGREEDAS